jgi:hypothetical protein
VRRALDEAIRSGHSIDDVIAEARRAGERARERAGRPERAASERGGRR